MLIIWCSPRTTARGESWWEAIPTEKHGDTFTLRWRDHAYLSKIVRARLSLALLCPNAK